MSATPTARLGSRRRQRAASAARWIAAVLLVLLAPVASGQQQRLDELRAAVAAERAALAAEPNRSSSSLALLDEAAAELDQLAASVERAAELRRLADSAAQSVAALTAELAGAPDTSEPPPPEGATLRDLEQLQQRSDAELVAARARVAELTDELATRQRRLEEIPQELADLTEEVGDLEQQLLGLPADDPLTTPRSLALNARLEARRARVAELEAERASYEARRGLLPLRRDRAQREVARADLLARLWQRRASEKRQEEAAAAARDAEARRQAAADDFAELGRIAERNAELAALRNGPEGIPARLDRATVERREIDALVREIVRRDTATRRKVVVGGVTEGVGNLLRRDAQWLPSASDLRAEAAERRRRISKWQLLQIELEEERDAVGDVGARHNELLASMRVALGEERAAELDRAALELVRTQRELLDTLIGELAALLSQLTEQAVAHDQLTVAADAYRRFVDERILWFPSGSVDDLLDGASHLDALRWLGAPGTWTELARSLAAGAQRARDSAALAILLLLGWLLSVRRLRRAVERLGAASRSFRTDRHRLTVESVAAVFAIVLPLPLATLLVVDLARHDPDATASTAALARAFTDAAWTGLALLLVREVARARGIGETLFRWRPSQLAPIRQRAATFGVVFVALASLSSAFEAGVEPTWADGPGRVAFVAAHLVLFAGLRRAFRGSGMWRAEEGDAATLAQMRLRRTWMFLVLAGPLAWVLLSLFGYGYAAVELGHYYRRSLYLGLAVGLVNSLLMRWLFVARRRLAVERAQARAQARAEAEKDGEIARELTGLGDEDLALPAIDAQTRQFFRSVVVVATVMGLYGIWSAGLPAVAVLDRIEVWPRFAHVEAEADVLAAPVVVPSEPATAADGAASPATTPVVPGVPALQPQPQALGRPVDGRVTVADLLLALIVVLLTTVATKNVPGLLEITVLKRLPLDGGARTALSTLSRYLILIVGSSAAFGALGIGWDKVQWLAAALTFGLAFGLQEVFANFVSGIIILLERPIRVGDIVTVGGIEGRVTRVRMRATTIMDWDRKELVVPNKDFITTSIVNWTLSDPVTRVIVPVGVAYGSDIELVHRLLAEVARKNPLVLDEPRAHVLFRAFGASSLDFELRIFIASRDVWPELIDRLHTEIDAAFRAHKVEIAFPQQDLHIRSAPGLDRFLGRGHEAGAAAGPTPSGS